MTHDVPFDRIAATLLALRVKAPRVQCLTNTVAQALTANCLLALGARVSMATHPDEVVDMAATADAILYNLGTLDAERIVAIPRLLAHADVRAKPSVLDPVFVQHSRLRLSLARKVAAVDHVVVKGNADEMAALTPDLGAGTARITTGTRDQIICQPRTGLVGGGHPYMAAVTGMGCAAGAVIAACLAVEADRFVAVVAALTIMGQAGQDAGRVCHGTGSFAVAFVDALSRLDAVRLEPR
jgi:hydroxyethylthiazole kinase